jgi:hypothetical protein
MKGAGAALLLLFGGFALAHDLITPESAEKYLTSAREWRQGRSSAANAMRRAEANYNIGVMLDEIRELLNRDLAAHGEVQGLASNLLVSELAKLGTPLAWSSEKKRYLANTGYFSESLKLSPRGKLAQDAAFRLLQGGFYDSFDSDPLETSETSADAARQIRLAEGLMQNHLSVDQREEVDFIAAVLRVRLARSSRDPAAQDKARLALDDFEARYPDSLRSAAVPVFREALNQ